MCYFSTVEAFKFLAFQTNPSLFPSLIFGHFPFFKFDFVRDFCNLTLFFSKKGKLVKRSTWILWFVKLITFIYKIFQGYTLRVLRIKQKYLTNLKKPYKFINSHAVNILTFLYGSYLRSKFPREILKNFSYYLIYKDFHID